MWGFLSTSHAQTNANDNLSNKPYFCLGLLTNLSDLLIPVYARSIVLGIFTPFLPFLPYLPLKMASHWARWMIFEQNKLYFNLMCFKLPWNLGVRALQIQAPPLWPNLIVRIIRTAAT